MVVKAPVKYGDLCCSSDDGLFSFCVHQVCLAKANSAASLDAVVVQDLSLGEGQGVENGDSLEVVYTGWLLQNHTFGQVEHFDHYFLFFSVAWIQTNQQVYSHWNSFPSHSEFQSVDVEYRC